VFFTYSQNNSGGSFIHDEDAGIAHYVIIEAASVDKANEKALDIGLYFNGCQTGMDCPCCGDRWSTPWEDDGDSFPSVYGRDATNPREYSDRFMGGGISRYGVQKGEPTTFVHYADGTKRGYGVPAE
jgi:hypothetical protein